MTTPTANTGQLKALEILFEGDNVFLTGAAGTGKSFVVQQFLSSMQGQHVAQLATTGTAAILIGGRTFHSFFGLWKFNGSYQDMVRSALAMRSLAPRIKNTDVIIIDEVSMLNSRTIRAGEEIARRIRGIDLPWGGMQVIATGDFCQLPPITSKRDREEGDIEGTDWVFNAPAWTDSDFRTVELTEIMRTSEARFMEILRRLRQGEDCEEVRSFLEERRIGALPAQQSDMPILFSRKENVAQCNALRLDRLPGSTEIFTPLGTGEERALGQLMRSCPVEKTLELKRDALVMIRSNSIEEGYANGSLGHFIEHDRQTDCLRIELLDGREILLPKKSFDWLNGEGGIVAEVSGFPVNLGWATTIHKSQGANVDSLIVDMGNIWESGQAYVALSRVRGEGGLRVMRPRQGKIYLDKEVREFYSFPSLSHD